MTKTGGRDATLRHIMGERALAVGMPNSAPPPGWKWVALTEVARLESGHTPSRKHPEYWGGDTPWLSIRDAKANHGGAIHETIENTNSLGIENSSARILPAGTVCLSRTASVGYVVVLGRPMATSQDFVNWVCSKELEPRFLQYLLIFEGPSLSRFSSGAVHQTIYFPEVKAFHICLPPLEEQRRIVAVLGEALAAIAAATANAEKNLANARELFEVERDAIVHGGGSGWVEGSLGDVCEPQYGISGSMNSEGKGYRIFRMGEVQDGRLIDTGAMKYIEISESEFASYKLKKGDVLFNRTNSIALVGKTGIFSLDGEYCFASYLLRMNLDHAAMSPRFACYLMNSRSFLARVRSKAAQSVNQANINATVLRNERVSYPKGIAEQEAISDRLDVLRRKSNELARGYERKLRELAALKQALLHRAFAGELTERDPLAA